MPAYTNIAQMLQQLQDPQMMGVMAQQLAQKGAPPVLPQGAAPGEGAMPGTPPGPGIGPLPSSLQAAQAVAAPAGAPGGPAVPGATNPAASGLMSGIGGELMKNLMAGGEEQYMAPVGGQVVGNKPAVSPMALPPMMPQQGQMPTLAQLIAGRR